MQGVENWIGSIVFLLVVITLPLLALIRRRSDPPPLPHTSTSDANPLIYCATGGLVATCAGLAGAVVAWGFLFPGLRWIEKNRWSELRILIPVGTRSRGQAAPLKIEDTEMSFLISAIASGFVLLGLFLFARGAIRFIATRKSA